MKDFKFNDLKAQVKVINESGLIETPIKLFGVSKDSLVEQFATAVESLSECGKEIPGSVVEFFNEIFADEAEPGEEVEPSENPTPTTDKIEPEDKGGTTVANVDTGETEEKVKPKPAPKRKPSKAPKSRYGHKMNTQSAKMDDMFWEGAKTEDVAELLGVKNTRVIAHLQHLKRDKGLTVVKDDNGVYKVTEEKVAEEKVAEEKAPE
jgi:hypothetical protein